MIYTAANKARPGEWDSPKSVVLMLIWGSPKRASGALLGFTALVFPGFIQTEAISEKLFSLTCFSMSSQPCIYDQVPELTIKRHQINLAVSTCL